jgi:hypothetical protein
MIEKNSHRRNRGLAPFAVLAISAVKKRIVARLLGSQLAKEEF